ncbi:antibiotic biosynthesis monooxygenase family protein [Jatrophihabitans sp.]|uniref:antibiotic biosynthesis monooxygenase family protein n=1 Tax=Jatrophihabitans sp. TaxID=1932789 RepID=UPI002B5D01B0|nr:antibiotic biosynthesis monooxygenase family protein [Jatrophihabitans sp.]
MIALLQFRPDPSGEAGDFQAEQFQEQAEQALRLLAERPGFVRGSVGRATDDAGSWLLFTEWESVGAYRRGLGGYQVKLLATPLLSQALDQPSAFEELLRIEADGEETSRPSDRADDADWTSR